uniref:Uncharacterized protein n=1 Tax=candidate division WOR-3 bacterium TaxID=2052148 RepID=A0A7C4UG66_UNCW3
MFLLFLSYIGFMEKENSTMFLRNDYLYRNYIEKEITDVKIPESVLMKEFFGGLIGEALFSVSALFLASKLANSGNDLAEIGMLRFIIFGVSLGIPSVLIGSSLGVSVTGKLLNHKGSITFSLLGSTGVFLGECFLYYILSNAFDLYLPEKISIPILIISMPIGAVWGYQINSTYKQ